MKLIHTDFFDDCNSFIKLPTSISVPGTGIEIIGWFPYETSMVPDGIKLPAVVYQEFEDIAQRYGIVDNKYTLICRCTEIGVPTHKFTLMFKDNWASVGKWEHLIGYDGHPLKRRNNGQN